MSLNNIQSSNQNAYIKKFLNSEKIDTCYIFTNFTIVPFVISNFNYYYNRPQKIK